MASASTPSVNPHLNPHSKAKVNYKITTLMIILLVSGISDVATATVHSEKNPSEEVDIYNYYSVE